MANDLATYLKNLPAKVERRLAPKIRSVADDLASAIRSAAPQGKTGKLKQSVQVTPGRDDLENFVDAGGALTTVEVRKGSGENTDYALHVEFGTQHAHAQPFFYSTYRANRQSIKAEISDAIADAINNS